MDKTNEITFEQALEIAKSLMSRFNTCTEYDNAYSFWYDWGEIRYGGIGAPCVIMKADGRAIGMSLYVIEYGGGDIIRKFPVDEYIRED